MKSGSRKGIKITLTAFAASVFAGALSSAAMAQNNPVANFDNGYLDEHPEVAQQLSNNPGLVDNQQYMKSHPGLQQFLANHPQVRSEIKQNPGAFMNAANQYNNGGPAGGPPMGGYWQGQGPGGQFGRGYFGSHPDVAQELAADPSLVNNPQFMANHPELQQYLNNHPQALQNLESRAQHPWGQRFHSWRERENSRDFLASHPEVAQQLEQHPELVNNQQYLASHPGLENYLNSHPGAESRWQSHPYRFMQNH